MPSFACSLHPILQPTQTLPRLPPKIIRLPFRPLSRCFWIQVKTSSSSLYILSSPTPASLRLHLGNPAIYSYFSIHPYTFEPTQAQKLPLHTHTHTSHHQQPSSSPPTIKPIFNMAVKEYQPLVNHCCSFCCKAVDFGTHDYCHVAPSVLAVHIKTAILS